MLPLGHNRQGEEPAATSGLPGRNQDHLGVFTTEQIAPKLVSWKLLSATENPKVSTAVLASGCSRIQGQWASMVFTFEILWMYLNIYHIALAGLAQ